MLVVADSSPPRVCRRVNTCGLEPSQLWRFNISRMLSTRVSFTLDGRRLYQRDGCAELRGQHLRPG